MTITSVVDRGHLHLGYGPQKAVPKELGKSINSYNNFITRFFSSLFHLSMQTKIAGKKRYVKIESLQNHLRSIGLNEFQIQEIKSQGYDEYIQRNHKKIQIGERYLGETLSDAKRLKLFKKLCSLLSGNRLNHESIQRLVKKGAYLEREFYVPLNNDRLNEHRGFWLTPREIIKKMQFFGYRKAALHSYTPLTKVAELGNQELAKLIISAKNNDVSKDRKKLVHVHNDPKEGVTVIEGEIGIVVDEAGRISLKLHEA